MPTRDSDVKVMGMGAGMTKERTGGGYGGVGRRVDDNLVTSGTWGEQSSFSGSSASPREEEERGDVVAADARHRHATTTRRPSPTTTSANPPLNDGDVPLDGGSNAFLFFDAAVGESADPDETPASGRWRCASSSMTSDEDVPLVASRLRPFSRFPILPFVRVFAPRSHVLSRPFYR